MTRTNRFLLDSVHRAESQRVIHRFIPSFVGSRPRFRWNNRHPHVLLLCASEVERRKKHGTPATSVAGVYSFLGPVIASAAKQSSATSGLPRLLRSLAMTIRDFSGPP